MTAAFAVATAAAALAACVHLVHLGVRIADGPTSFISRFTAEALDTASVERASDPTA